MRTVRAWWCMRTVRASPGVYENIKIITGVSENSKNIAGGI